jgi:hypothetical protein
MPDARCVLRAEIDPAVHVDSAGLRLGHGWHNHRWNPQHGLPVKPTLESFNLRTLAGSQALKSSRRLYRQRPDFFAANISIPSAT